MKKIVLITFIVLLIDQLSKIYIKNPPNKKDAANTQHL